MYQTGEKGVVLMLPGWLCICASRLPEKKFQKGPYKTRQAGRIWCCNV